MVFADTNWLEALYFTPSPSDREAVRRAAIVQRRMRKYSGILTISHLVLLEARNVFGRVAGKAQPMEWQDLLGDINRRLCVLPLEWEPLRRETNRLFDRLSHKMTLGTFDATLLASMLLSGARELLSFDERLKAAAASLGVSVFPPLTPKGKVLSAELRR